MIAWLQMELHGFDPPWGCMDPKVISWEQQLRSQKLFFWNLIFLNSTWKPWKANMQMKAQIANFQKDASIKKSFCTKKLKWKFFKEFFKTDCCLCANFATELNVRSDQSMLLFAWFLPREATPTPELCSKSHRQQANAFACHAPAAASSKPTPRWKKRKPWKSGFQQVLHPLLFPRHLRHPKMSFFTRDFLLAEEGGNLAFALGWGPGFALQAAGLLRHLSKLFAFLLERLWCAWSSYSSKVLLGSPLLQAKAMQQVLLLKVKPSDSASLPHHHWQKCCHWHSSKALVAHDHPSSKPKADPKPLPCHRQVT